MAKRARSPSASADERDSSADQSSPDSEDHAAMSSSQTAYLPVTDIVYDIKLNAVTAPSSSRRKSLGTPGKRKRKSRGGAASASVTPQPGTDPTAAAAKSLAERSQEPADLPPAAYTVTPTDSWMSMRKYKNFVVGDEEFSTGSYVLVNYSGRATMISDEQDAAELRKDFWIARVLEVRAADATRVFLRVYWCYWPEELPGGGRKDYHGYQEVVLSDHMQVVDASTVAGRAEVRFWDEEDETQELMAGLYWRQKLDWSSGELSV